MTAYLEGTADAAAVERLRAATGGAVAFEADAGALRDYETLLLETGNALRGGTPPVDMLDAVMEAVRRGDVPVDTPDDGVVPDHIDPRMEQALTDTADALSGALPQINLLDGVMRGLAHLRDREAVTGVPAAEADVAAAVLALRVEDVGAELREKTPKVDIVEPVMEGVKADDPPAGQNVIPFRARPRVRASAPQVPAMRLWAFRAAAVLLVGVAAVGGWVVFRSDGGTVNLARGDRSGLRANPVTSGKKDHLAALKATARKHLPKDDGRVSNYEKIVRPVPAIPLIVEEKSNLAALTMDEIIAAKRDALGQKSGAAEKLAALGRLTPEEARRLLEEGGLSAAAMLGAIQALPADEAANYLRAAVEKSPDDPYLRYMLARNLMANPATREEARAQIAAMKDLAGDNALPYYMDAGAKLSDGDVNGALLAMDLGAGLETATPYGLETARNRSAALEAGGVAADVARFLAASSAGQAEYNDLMAMGQELMSYGQQYESVKDYETAQAIYNAVETLGVQVQQGAALSNEQLAGFDLQMVALDAVARLADVLKTPDGRQFIEGTYSVLAGSLSTFMDYLTGVGSLFAGVDAAQAAQLGGQILNQGDLNLPVTTGQQ